MFLYCLVQLIFNIAKGNNLYFLEYNKQSAGTKISLALSAKIYKLKHIDWNHRYHPVEVCVYNSALQPGIDIPDQSPRYTALQGYTLYKGYTAIGKELNAQFIVTVKNLTLQYWYIDKKKQKWLFWRMQWTCQASMQALPESFSNSFFITIMLLKCNCSSQKNPSSGTNRKGAKFTLDKPCHLKT